MANEEYFEMNRFKENGLLIKKGLFSEEEILSFQEETLKLWENQKDINSYNLRIGLRKNDKGEVVFERLDPVADISELFNSLNSDERIVSIIEKLIEEKCQIMKEKLIYKWPGTSGYGAHRDITYFNSSGCQKGEELISAAIALDDINEDNGAIKFYPKLRYTELKSPKEEDRDLDEEELKSYQEFMPNVKAGDVIFFDGLVPHLSDFNRSKRNRRVYMITYIPKRYENGRKKYYENRLKEQTSERSKVEDGEYFLG